MARSSTRAVASGDCSGNRNRSALIFTTGGRARAIDFGQFTRLPCTAHLPKRQWRAVNTVAVQLHYFQHVRTRKSLACWNLQKRSTVPKTMKSARAPCGQVVFFPVFIAFLPTCLERACSRFCSRGLPRVSTTRRVRLDFRAQDAQINTQNGCV